MVARRRILEIALRAWRDRGTAMAAAMLRAFGLCPALVESARAPEGERPDARFEGIAECMANRESPMDRLR